MTRYLRPALAAMLLATVLTVGAITAPATARNTPGNLTLKVTAVCSAPGDSVKWFEVWTPENGGKTVYPAPGTKSATIDMGTINKKVWGDTYFNWMYECRLSGATGPHQKRYGGSLFATSYSYTATNFYGRLTMP